MCFSCLIHFAIVFGSSALSSDNWQGSCYHKTSPIIPLIRSAFVDTAAALTAAAAAGDGDDDDEGTHTNRYLATLIVIRVVIMTR